MFGAFDIIFVDGNSTDNSKQIFEKYAFQKGDAVSIKFISFPSEHLVELKGPFKGYKMPREGRIAMARNKGLQVIRNSGYADSSRDDNYVIMIDADILGWDTRGMIDTFGKRDDWDIVCANGVMFNGIYRDTYAFRSPQLETNHHWTGSDLSLYNVSKDLLMPENLS